MKVTVYFGSVRVIVPCGKGDILVRDLMDMAITRYRKATGKPSSSVIRIRNLKSSRDDGILYPDDKLSDVADDREQIIADFEENYSPIPHYNSGDRTSTSSVCTGSPDLFSVEVSSHGSLQYAHSDVEITEESTPLGVTPLQVRRGSEPALNSLCPSSPTSDPSKRWSTAVVINPGSPEKQKDSDDCETMSKEPIVNGDAKQPSRNFSRGSGRLSILGNNSETYRWVEAADRQLMKDLNDKLSMKPLTSNCSLEHDAASDSSSDSEEREQTIILKNESGPLGIHVVPDYDNKGRDTGLVIQGIEAGGRIDRDGRFCVGDRIVEINGQSLRSVSFQTAQEVFKNALKTPQIKLELVRGTGMLHSKTAASIPRKPPPPIYPKPAHPAETKKQEDDSPLVEGEERAGGVTTKVATVTPTKKMPAIATHRLAAANTRKIGKKISIQLTKGSAGLGFSITTRDNPARGNSPIYIKNVLPKGAAIEDGRLKPGDRLLEVNNIEMTGKSQSEAVQILRNTPLGGVVNLVVSRQETESPHNSECETNSVPHKLEEETGIFPWKHRDILTFQIPLNDTSSAGLGVSVKGKSTAASSGSVDLGIFIKSIINGGAASKDGRLRANDQLVNINGISLLGMSNSSAMETLRKAMTQLDGPIPNNIILTIARRTTQPSEDELDSSSQHSKLSNVNSQGSVLSYASEKLGERQIFPRESSTSSDNYDNPLGPMSSLNCHMKDLENGQSLDTNPPGCNPIIERLTGQTEKAPFKKLPSESYVFNMSNNVSQPSVPSRTDRNSMFSPTICVPPCESVLIEGEYNAVDTNSKCSVPPENANAQNENNLGNNVAPASSQLSLEEINAGFARDGFGRQSMSEKRHAQLDAKNTDTYQRNKKAREERERNRHLDDEYYQMGQQMSSQGKSETHLYSAPSSAADDEPRGPSLGLRKSSSLESLQTMIQELNKDDEAMKKTLQSTNGRGSRSRGCNESFRAAVDRSYEAPAPSAMETLDEESESGSSVGHILGRASEVVDASERGLNRDGIPEDILNLYCRSSKSSKKKSLLKGLGSVFKFGKSRKGMNDGKGKNGDETSHDSESSPQSSMNKEQERPEQEQRPVMEAPKKPLPSIPREVSSSSCFSDSIPNRQERMQSLREQHQRLHQKRQGHYPLEQKEELYESEIQAKENQLNTGIDIAHSRSHSHDEILNKAGSRAAFSEAGRYSHYMNYKEIQQHMTQYYHHDQPAKLPYNQNIGSYRPKNTAYTERPSSNYFEYESVQQLQRHAGNQGPESDTSSLPRGSHVGDHPLPHVHAQPNKHMYNHEFTGRYERRNIHHYFSNNNNGMFPHIVPGSKV